MPAAPPPPNETARYAALMGYHLRHNMLRDNTADELVRKAIRDFDVPQAAIAVVGETTVYFISESGAGFQQIPRALSFCGYAIHSRDPLIVPNAVEDVRFADNPLVTGPPFVRFYAGAPLIDRDGYCLGTFCIVHMQPRSFTAEQAGGLVRLSERAMQRIDLLSTVSTLTPSAGLRELV